MLQLHCDFGACLKLHTEGECWVSGIVKESTKAIPAESLGYQNYLYIQKHLELAD